MPKRRTLDHFLVSSEDKFFLIQQEELSSKKRTYGNPTTISTYLRAWTLKLSVNKSVASVFHLRNHMANYQLQITLNSNNLLRFKTNPKYLGVHRDRSLNFRSHINHLRGKVSSRLALIKHLVNVKWEASFNTIRTFTLALVYAPAEYCAPAWCRSAHVCKIDVPLHEAMRTITGCF